MELRIDASGVVTCLYAEAIDLGVLGQMSISRASYVEPDEAGRWWADLAPVSGPRLGPFPRRSDALAAEVAWLEENLFPPHCGSTAEAGVPSSGRSSDNGLPDLLSLPV
jgi:hypothetical protein